MPIYGVTPMSDCLLLCLPQVPTNLFQEFNGCELMFSLEKSFLADMHRVWLVGQKWSHFIKSYKRYPANSSKVHWFDSIGSIVSIIKITDLFPLFRIFVWTQLIRYVPAHFFYQEGTFEMFWGTICLRQK